MALLVPSNTKAGIKEAIEGMCKVRKSRRFKTFKINADKEFRPAVDNYRITKDTAI